jgi:hypothetical protein
MLAVAPWDLEPNLPWSVFTSPAAQWASLPSFLVGEYLFYACTIVALIHAIRCGRGHVMAWVAALLAGTANDLIFMALPMVDNFWQAQATIMLTPRLPLYIPCVYVCFMYFPTVAVWRLGLPRLAQATLTGVTASLFYAPYDIVGAKFLWWTWHDTDMPIANRLLGVPVGSTMWIITFVSAFALFLSWGRRCDDPKDFGKVATKGFLAAILLSTTAMGLQMQPLQLLDGGIPGPVGLVFIASLYLGIAAWQWRRRVPGLGCASDGLLRGAAIAYFAGLALIMGAFDPATHRSESMHQVYGACHVEAKDILGFTRYEFVCAEDFDEDYSFACVDALPAEGSPWYTVCGRAHTDYPRYLGVVATLATLGILFFGGALRRRRDD